MSLAKHRLYDVRLNRFLAHLVCLFKDEGQILLELERRRQFVAEGDQGFISDDRLDLRLGFCRLRHQPLEIFAVVAAQAFYLKDCGAQADLFH